MLCKCYWIVLYTVHVTAFSLGGASFPDTVYVRKTRTSILARICLKLTKEQRHYNDLTVNVKRVKTAEADLFCGIKKTYTQYRVTVV